MREQDRRGMWTPDCWCVHCLHCQLCLMCELSIYYVFVMWPDCQPITQRNAADCDGLCGLRHKLLIKYIKSLLTHIHKNIDVPVHAQKSTCTMCMVQNQMVVNIFSSCFRWLLRESSGWRWWNVLIPQLLMTCAGRAWFSSTPCCTIYGSSLLKEKGALWTTIESLQVLLIQPLLGFVWVSRSGNSCPDLQTKRAIFNGIWSSFNWERW